MFKLIPGETRSRPVLSCHFSFPENEIFPSFHRWNKNGIPECPERNILDIKSRGWRINHAAAGAHTATSIIQDKCFHLFPLAVFSNFFSVKKWRSWKKKIFKPRVAFPPLLKYRFQLNEYFPIRRGENVVIPDTTICLRLRTRRSYVSGLFRLSRTFIKHPSSSIKRPTM